MDKKAHDRIVRSRVQLLMSFPFFGSLALYLELVEMNSIPTGATDGDRYYYNSSFVNKLTEEEVNFLTAHEVLHPALGHIWRRGTKDKLIWNHATDYVINLMIKEADPAGKTFKLIKGILYNEKFKDMSSDEVYEILISDKNYVDNAYKNAQGMSGGFGSGSTPWVLDDHDIWDQSDFIEGDDDDDDQKSGKISEEDWKHRVVAAAQVASQKDPGNVPSLFRRMITDLTEPKKDWKQLLAEFITVEFNDYGYSPPDRRHLWNDVILPDFSEPEDTIKWIIFGVDTSGSITAKHFNAFISEVVGCLNQFGGKVKGKLIYCDAEIPKNGVYEIEDAAHSLPVGGGGTDFRPVFKWIEENMEDECSGLVYLTDTYGSFPSKAPEYPVLWASTEENATVPFGDFTYLKV